MKLIIAFVLTLVSLVTTECIYAQTNVAGLWQVDWNKTHGAMSQAEQNKFNALPEQTRSRVISSFSTRTFDFNENATFEVSWQSNSGPRTESGTWSISDAVLSTIVNGSTKAYDVSRQEDTLTLSLQTIAEGALITTLVMTKQ